MQQLPLTVQTDSRKLVEDLYDFLGTLVRGWRLVAVCVAITMTAAVIYLATGQAGLPGFGPPAGPPARGAAAQTGGQRHQSRQPVPVRRRVFKHAFDPHHDHPQPADRGPCWPRPA